MEIDPNQETAYRYWGDALWAMGRSVEAREKYTSTKDRSSAVMAEQLRNYAEIVQFDESCLVTAIGVLLCAENEKRSE